MTTGARDAAGTRATTLAAGVRGTTLVPGTRGMTAAAGMRGAMGGTGAANGTPPPLPAPARPRAIRHP